MLDFTKDITHSVFLKPLFLNALDTKYLCALPLWSVCSFKIKSVVLVLMVHSVLCEQLTLHVILVVFHQFCRILRTLPTIPCSKARQLLLFPSYCSASFA